MLRRRRLEVKENTVILVSVQEPHSPLPIASIAELALRLVQAGNVDSHTQHL